MKDFIKKIFNNKKTILIISITTFAIICAIVLIILLNKPKQNNEVIDNYYTISYETNCEEVISNIKVKENTILGKQTDLYKFGCIFLGWYYDENFTNIIDEADQVKSNITLYARFSDEQAVNQKQNITFACETDVNSDFTINLVAKEELTVEAVEALINCYNITDDNDIDTIQITKSNQIFVIRGSNEGFIKGCSYKLTINSDLLYFKEYADEVKELSFTIQKEEVLNLQLQNDVKYIEISKISNIIENDQAVELLSHALINVNNDINTINKGSFEYVEGNLAIGDKVAIYSGLRPDLRTLQTSKEENGSIAYLIITKKSGNVYEFVSAKAEEIIFKPDILPVNIIDDLDGDPNNNSLKIEKYAMNYSDDVYLNIGLDATTTIDPGDFLAFYQGVFGDYDTSISKYGVIVEINEYDDYLIIDFNLSNLEEIQNAMDIYASQAVSGDEMLDNVDQAELLSSIEDSAINSNFVDDTASYLTKLALRNQGIKVADSEVKFVDRRCSLNVADYNIDVTTDVDASISTTLKQFKDYNGLRLTLSVLAKVIITNKASKERTILKITASFEQEVRLALGVSSKAVWKVFGIFPYISEYKVSLNIDLFDYTGFSIDAIYTIVTPNENGEYDNSDKYEDITNQLKAYIDNPNDSDGKVLANNLTACYEELLNSDTDWVKIVNKQIFEKEFRVPAVLPIIAADINVNFVVRTDMSACTGFAFHYKNAKRYIYTVSVFKGKLSNDVINIANEEYEMTYYLIGKLKVKAGIEASFKVGLLSTKLDSIGFTAEAGVYLKCYGYFFYNLKGENETKKITREGPFDLEIGAYIDINFVAQALFGKYSSTSNIVYKEYPFWENGEQSAVLDFATKEDEVPEVLLKQYIRNASLPDSLFMMKRQDLYTGEINNVLYNDETDFIIEMTNKSFVYNPSSNMITVNPKDGETKLEGDLIITYKYGPLLFTSEKMQRVIHLYWDNLRDGYVILPFTNGGSYINTIVKPAGESFEVPLNPTKIGYEFDGWYLDKDFNENYLFPEVMPESDTTIFAKWVPSNDTLYTVEHYQIKLGSSLYELKDSINYRGTTDATVRPEVMNYGGFIAPVTKELVIAPDGSSILRYYYT